MALTYLIGEEADVKVEAEILDTWIIQIHVLEGIDHIHHVHSQAEE